MWNSMQRFRGKNHTYECGMTEKQWLLALDGKWPFTCLQYEAKMARKEQEQQKARLLKERIKAKFAELQEFRADLWRKQNDPNHIRSGLRSPGGCGG